jgi:hypothetical protein
MDSAHACPPLTVSERTDLHRKQGKAAVAISGEVAKVRAAFIQQHAKEISQRTGISELAARATAARFANRVLLPEVKLVFADPVLANKTVGDVLANPKLFEKKSLADPTEGIGYGRQTAMILIGKNGLPWIRSYAHHGINYRLIPHNKPTDLMTRRELAKQRLARLRSIHQ